MLRIDNITNPDGSINYTYVNEYIELYNKKIFLAPLISDTGIDPNMKSSRYQVYCKTDDGI